MFGWIFWQRKELDISKNNNLNKFWQTKNNHLELSLQRDDFQQVIDLVNKISAVAEELDHHPDLLIHDYNQLTISISNHEKGQLGDIDFQLAEKIEKLLL